MIEPSVAMGVGNQIFAGAVVGSAAKLGDGTIINSGTIVSHDCLIGSHTHFSPGAILAGGVEVGENTLVGMGVTVYLGVRIGSNVVISNGSHIMKDVPDGSVIRTGTSSLLMVGRNSPCGDSCPRGPEVPGRSDPSTKRIAAVDPTQPKPLPMLVTIELFSGVFYCMLVEASRSIGLILFI
jgi:UDP-3-O-[3-hydroxymyristoyl] glucosamine N-acyltransferase